MNTIRATIDNFSDVVYRFAELMKHIEELTQQATINAYNHELSKLLYELSDALNIEDTDAEELLVRLQNTIKSYLEYLNYK